MDKKRFLRKLNNEHANRGAALVSVIIAMTVVSILGLLALSVSYDTFRMKQVEKNASENFYGAEKALEGIAVGLQEVISECHTEAYTEVMVNYASYDTALEMQMNYENKLLAKLSDVLDSDKDGYYDVSMLEAYAKGIFTTEESEYISVKSGTEDAPENYLNATTSAVVLRNVMVTYKDAGYSDQIVTDIKLSVPAVTFERIVNLPAIMDYAIIAEQGIDILGGGGEKTVSGNMFVGVPDVTADVTGNVEGDLVSFSMSMPTSFTAKNESGASNAEIIFEGDVTLSSNASFTADAKTTLWANGLETNAAKEVLPGAGKTNSLYLLGTSYVKDDITVNGANNLLTLGGRYFGYSTGTTEASESSAIIINGMNTSIDIKDINTMVLAGTSFVGTKGEAYDSLPIATQGLNDHDVFMGDSIAVKGNQLIYMVPKECEGIQNNPMTYEQYLALSDGWQAKVLSTRISGLGRTIGSYGDVKITPVFTNKMGGAVYLYLEFASTEAASKYFMDNYGVSANGQKVKDILQSYVKMFTSATNGQIFSAGNYLVSGDAASAVYEAATSGIQDMNLQEAYENKCKEMQFDQLINKSVLKQLVSGQADGIYKAEVEVISDDILQIKSKIQLVVVDNEGGDPFVIDKDFDGTGVVIATGDVEVNQDHQNKEAITGMILCGGKLTILGTYQEFKADSEVIAKALGIENEESGISGMDLFNGYGGNADSAVTSGTGEDKNDIRNCVTFENWKAQ